MAINTISIYDGSKKYFNKMSVPTVKLSYDQEAHEFKLEVKHAKEVDYEISYHAREFRPEEETENSQILEPTPIPTPNSSSLLGDMNSTESGTLNNGIIRYGFAGAGESENGTVFSVSNPAGTESTGVMVFHDVLDGMLAVTVITPENQRFYIEQIFVIEKSGEVKILSTETRKKLYDPKVLGEEATSDSRNAQAVEKTEPQQNVFSQHLPTGNIVDTNIFKVWFIASLIIGLIVAILVILKKKSKLLNKRKSQVFQKKIYTHSTAKKE